MRTILLWAVAAILMPAAMLPAQNRDQGISQPKAQAPGAVQQQDQQVICGRGRGGVPCAWNDRDKDGICDLTGRPVGQGRPLGFGGGRRGGRGGAAWGGGWGAGRGRGFAARGGGWWRSQVAQPPQQVQPAASDK